MVYNEVLILIFNFSYYQKNKYVISNNIILIREQTHFENNEFEGNQCINNERVNNKLGNVHIVWEHAVV
jgi:hypothetical protein